MAEVIEELQREHRDLAKLMGVIERQAEVLHDGRAPDCDLLRSVLRYISNYPNLLHHPKEDLVYRRLAERDQAAVVEVHNVLQEHGALEDMAANLAALVDDADGGPEGARAELENMARGYVDAYRRHMAMEEGELFPRALGALSEADWAAIAVAVSGSSDPLFDGAATNQYRNLHSPILRLGARARARLIVRPAPGSPNKERKQRL